MIMKKIFILFSTILLIISLGGCSMFINRKAIAEKALQEQYGEEFVAYHTWDHGGDSFRASMYPKADESIKFNAHVRNTGKVITDYYPTKIIAKTIIGIVSPYIDEITEESAYYSTVGLYKFEYTSKGQVTLKDYFTNGGGDFQGYPYIYICINTDKIKNDVSYEKEYNTYMEIFKDDEMQILKEKQLVLYFLNNQDYLSMKEDFVFRTAMTSSFDQLKGSDKEIRVKEENGIINISLEEYIQKRKELSYE